MLPHALAALRSPNLIIGGRFENGTVGWSAVATPTTLENSNGRGHVVGDAANDGIGQAVTCTLGRVWELRFDYEIISGNVNVLKTGMTSITNLSGSGSYIHRFVESDGASRTLRWVTAAAGEFYIDRVRLFRPF